VGRIAAVILSVPPLSRHMKILAGTNESQRGHAQDHNCHAPKFPLPLSQLVRPRTRPLIEVSTEGLLRFMGHFSLAHHASARV
jgi:hypothetical protein